MADLSPPPSNEVIPSEEILDESPQNEDRPSRAKKRKRSSARILFGLDESCVITISDEESDAEKNPKGVIPTPSPTQVRKRRVTRQTIHGRAEALYDAKYHPMDEVTRPKNAARHRGQSIKVALESEDDAPMPDLPSGSEDDDDEEEEGPVRVGKKVFRPGTRRSRRKAAKNRPFYDRSKHPQDAYIDLSDERPRSKRLPRKKPKPKPVYVEDSASTQSVIHVQSDESGSESEEEFTMRGALNGREQVVSKKRTVSEIPDSTSGLGEELSPLEDLLSSAPQSSQPQHPSFSDEVGLLEPGSDTSRSEHTRLLDDTQGPNAADSPPQGKPNAEDDGTKQDSNLSEETVLLDYNELRAGKQRRLVKLPVSQIPSFYLSSQASVGQIRTEYVTDAELRRRAGNFAIFQDDEDPSQTTPVLTARFYELESNDQENRAPTEERRPAAEEDDEFPAATQELPFPNHGLRSPSARDESPHLNSDRLPSETASGVDAAVEFLAASFHEAQSKNRIDSAKDELDMVAGADDELEQLNCGSSTGEHENLNTLNCANVQPALETPDTDLQSRDADAEEGVTKISERSCSPSNLDTEECASCDSRPEIARHGSPAVFSNDNVEENDPDQRDDPNHYSVPKSSWRYGPSTDISGPNITGDEPDDANKQLLSDHLSQFVAEEQAAWSEDHCEIQHEALAEPSFFSDAMEDNIPRLPFQNPCM